MYWEMRTLVSFVFGLRKLNSLITQVGGADTVSHIVLRLRRRCLIDSTDSLCPLQLRSSDGPSP